LAFYEFKLSFEFNCTNKVLEISMLYNETQASAPVPLQRSQTKLLKLPTSHLAIAAIAVGLLDMIASDPSLLEWQY